MSTAPQTAGRDPGEKPKPWETRQHANHWRAANDEYEGGKLGMWLFLATEILLFSGFFCAYAVFRMLYPGNWASASDYYLNWIIGGANTLVLLLSSWTIVMAIRAAQLGKRGPILVYLGITQACAAFFLVVKLGWEYLPKIQKGELPGGYFRYPGHAVDEHHASAVTDGATHIIQAAAGDPRVIEATSYAEKLASHAHFVPSEHDQIFLSIYWVATATHGFHVFVGMIVIAMCMWKAAKWEFGPKNYLFLENTGLYWHLVDLIWIFLFPMLYLV